MAITTDQARSLIERVFDATNNRDLDNVVAAGFVRHCQATPQLEINSIDDFKTYLRADAAAFPDNVQTITHLAADGDLIGVFATCEGTHLGPLGPFEPTGKHAKCDFAGMFKVEADKLSELWVTWDNMTIVAGLGLLAGGENTEA